MHNRGLKKFAAAAAVIFLFAGCADRRAADITVSVPIATPAVTVIPTPTPVATPLPTPTPTPAPVTMWGANFPGMFTDGEVVRDEDSYKSAHVSVSVKKVQEGGVTYFAADIYITDLRYFAAPFSSGEYKGDRKFVYNIARDEDAVIAINGDYYTQNPGPVLRDGELYRNKVKLDILVMFRDGTMKTYTNKEYDKEMIEAMKDDIWQIWTFGPMLLDGGEPMTEFNLPKKIGRANPRTAIGYYEPGHYVFVTVDGRQAGYSKGLSMKALSQLMYDLGCSTAFNLDGGGSAQMAFMGEEINQPCGTYRKDKDAICIVDEPAATTPAE